MLYTSGKNLAIKPIFKSGNKTLTHDELVLCVDWNFSNKLIISGGEDKKYKLWDQFGRNLFVSLPYNYVTTSIAWEPSGEYFAVGSFDMLRLCNKTGWTYSFNKVDSGSLFKLSWIVMVQKLEGQEEMEQLFLALLLIEQLLGKI